MTFIEKFEYLHRTNELILTDEIERKRFSFFRIKFITLTNGDRITVELKFHKFIFPEMTCSFNDREFKIRGLHDLGAVSEIANFYLSKRKKELKAMKNR